MNKHVILKVFSGLVDTYGISRAMSSLGWGSQRSVSIFVFASASQAVKVYHFLPNDMSLLITSVLSPFTFFLFLL